MSNEGIDISDTPLMTVSGLASYLSVSKSLVYKWVEEGKIPHYRFGKTVRFATEEVKEWLKAQRTQPTSALTSQSQFERDVDKILNSTRIGTKL